MRRMGICLGMRPEVRTTCGGKREARERGEEGQFGTKGNGRKRLGVESLKLKARKEKDQAYGTRGEGFRLEWGRENWETTRKERGAPAAAGAPTRTDGR